jgi:hypothetical protein
VTSPRRSRVGQLASLGFLVAVALFTLAPTSAAQSTKPEDRVVSSLTDCGLGEDTNDLSLLFLIDESGSLQKQDKDNHRVEGTIAALDALYRLGRDFQDKNIAIRVAIHGFHAEYVKHKTSWIDLDSPDSLEELKRTAETYRTLNTGPWTDYTKALRGAANELDASGKGCRVLVWFTDGEFDNSVDGILVEKEKVEIREDLCATTGPVDALRRDKITMIVIGLSNKDFAAEEGKDPPDLSLVRAIASGDKVVSAKFELGNSECGSLPGTGNLYEADRPAELIEDFARILGDKLFETLEDKELQDPLPCGPDPNLCLIPFDLGPWADQFHLVFKLPPSLDGQRVQVFLEPPNLEPILIDRPDGPIHPDLPGISGESPTVSWRKLHGVRNGPGNVWNGMWHLRFEGPGAHNARAHYDFINGEVGVELAGRNWIDATDPSTYSGVGLRLTSGGEELDCATHRPPIVLAFTGSLGGRTKEHEPLTAGPSCEVPAALLADLLSNGTDNELKLSVTVTPSIVISGPFEPVEFEASTMELWLQDIVVVELIDEAGTHISHSDPASYESIEVRLFKGGQLFDRGGVDVALRTAPKDQTLGSATTDEFSDDEPLILPADLLADALSAKTGQTLLRLDLQVTPQILAGEGAGLAKGSSAINLWVHDRIVYVRTNPDGVLDNQNPETFDGHTLTASVGGRPFDNPRAEMSLRLEALIDGGPTDVVQYEPGTEVDIPAKFFVDSFRAAGNTSLSLLTIRVTPTATIAGDSHPGLTPSTIQFPVRSGPGFPVILGVTAADIEDKEAGALSVLVLGPDQGTGEVKIVSVAPASEELQGSFTIEEFECRDLNSGIHTCKTVLDADFTANQRVELIVTLTMSGTDTKPADEVREVLWLAEFEMSRPLNKAGFVFELLKLLLLFVLVQVLLRALFTTRLAKWDGVAPNSRWKTLPVTVGPEGTVSAVGGGALTVDPTTTMFATELEGRNSTAVIDDVHFEISWLRTFIGERQETGFGRSQRAVIRATASTNHCIAPEGSEPTKGTGPSAGLIGTTFRECWVLQLPTSAITTLATGEPTSAQLLVLFKPFEGGPSAADQLDEVSDRLNDVTAREIPRLIEAGQVDQSSGAADTDEVETGKAGAPGEDDKDDDSFDKPVADPTNPFGDYPTSTSDSPTSTSSGSTEPSEWDHQVRDPDDPFA